MSNELVRLRQFIVEHYDLDELRTLCFDLGVRYEELGEGGLTARVRQLLLLLGREHRLDELLAALQYGRGELLQQAGFSESPTLLDRLYTALPAFRAEGRALAPRPRDQQILLEKVKIFWVEGVLEKSLHHAALIEVGKEVRPDAVDYPWEMVVQSPDQESYTLPANKHVVNVFDDSGQSLLILGAPGSGKTTMLLELARATIARAEQDPALPVPAVFNLSSWHGMESIDDWLVNELNQKYLIPKRIGRGWVESDGLLFLLDGLDEVALEHRSACVEAINEFRRDHLVGMVICSRSEEYETLTSKLKLQRAIFLQPFTDRQIDAYLAAAGSKLTAVHIALQSDKTLRELAHSPLLLSIMSIAYQNITVAELSRIDSVTTRRAHLFGAYVRLMFKRRGTGNKYSQAQTIYWLSWLAQRMSEHAQSIFLIERMQPSWLETRAQRLLYSILVVLILVLLVSPVIGPLITPVTGLIVVVFGVVSALLLSISDIKPVRALKWSWGEAAKSSLVGLLLGFAIGLAYGFLNRMSITLVLGLGLICALVCGLLIGVIRGLSDAEVEMGVTPNHGIHQSVKNAIVIWLGIGIVFMLLGGLFFGVLGEPNLTPEGELAKGPIRWFLNFILSGPIGELKGTVGGFVHGLISGLIGGLVIGLAGGLLRGGIAAIQHYALRFVLWLNGHVPWNYSHFLDYAAEHLFLRKVGGGYIFVHRLLLEYFAEVEQPVDGM